MFDASETHEDWRVLFHAWRQAERESREEAAFHLLADLVAARCVLRQQSDSNTLSPLDIDLLIKFGTQLEQRRKYREARSTYESGRAHLRRQRDECGSAFFSLRAVRCYVALLDFAGAGQELGNVLAIEENLLHNVPRTMQAAATLSFMSADLEKVHVVRVEALVNLSEYWAACGKLSAAEQALQRTYALLSEQASKYVTAPNVLVRLGEIRLDRGDFPGVEQLLTMAHASDLSPTTAAQWLVLEAQLRHLQGRFSEAKELLSSVAQASDSIVTEEIVMAAARQRFHTLCALNRLDEAEVVVEGLQRTSVVGEGEMDGMRTLLARRRGVAISSLGVPPSTREILGAVDSDDVLPEPLGDGEVEQIFVQGPRTRQRVRDEYGRSFNQVLLALHAGQHERALLLCTHLSALASNIDSALVEARQLHLWAYVYYYCEDWKAARDNAEQACSAYAKLGMLNGEWSMRGVIGWIMRRSGGLVSEIQRNSEEVARLSDEIAARLQPEDRSMYALNKWSDIDEQVSKICHRLDHEEVSLAGRFPTWLTRRRVSRVTRTALVEILKFRALGGEQGNNVETDNLDAGPANQEQDIYALALRAIRRRLRENGILNGAAWLHASWLPSDTAVLHYIVLPDRVELFVMTHGRFERIRPLQKATRAELWGKVSNTLRNLRSSAQWHGKTESAGRRVADLGACVGFTELRFPPNIRNLVVVPDDILVNVPFAALPIGDQPCISRFTLRVIPMLAWTESTVRPFKKYRSALGIAVTASAAEPGYAPLHGITQEVRALANGSAPTWQYVENQDAKADHVKAKLLETDIAHFACHGEFSIRKPGKSGLLLHDRWLTIEDLDELKLDHLAVVVLNSCWGGSTQTLPGNVHVGMPFALLDRGVQIVVASLWQASHRDAIEFAQSLYQESAESGPIVGLARVQQKWTTRKPLTWAGYTAYSAGIVPARPWRWLLPLLRRWQSLS
ncbi:CHAT domain-containing protein [Nitrospira sp. BLG_2]|uniref:CHAT domain-containing protein n=1 Tax=Nitrospira sp. BLG_2 TaxID=3397507 RepID=UPI003B9A3A10